MSELMLGEGRQRKRRHSAWVGGYLQSRTKYGDCNCIMRDLQVHGEDKLKYYIRLDLSTFEELFGLFSAE